MVTRSSLNNSMDSAVKHYASLFKLPSHWKIITLQLLLCTFGTLISMAILFRTVEGLLSGVLVGFSLFLASVISDYMVSKWLLKEDPIYDPRRTAMLSLACLGLWFPFALSGALVALLSGMSWLIRFCLLGFSAALVMRLIVFKASSSTGGWRAVASSFLQPLFCVLPLLGLWIRAGYFFTLNMVAFLAFSSVASVVSAFSFLSLLDRIGLHTLDVPSLSLLRAFLLNWIVGLNAPFENILERLGNEQDVEVSLVKFDTSKVKIVIAVPSVHPGPFRNIGSSLLPSLLKGALETELGCVACVPLGLQGHELDLVSQRQNQKVIRRVTDSVNFETEQSEATPLVRISSDTVTACCQILGEFALLSFTLAPNTTEDLPQELGSYVQQEAKKLGLTCCVAINAHNSINCVEQVSDVLDALKSVASACLVKAASLRKMSFEVGAAAVMPTEFGLEDGMGAGGITVVVTKVGAKKVAYVVIDGNNMVSGLREKILASLCSVGIDKGEVFTTDAHSVSAIVLGKRGYHPIGETMDHEKLINYVEKATQRASNSLARAKVACRIVTVPNVKVIGEKRLETLSLLIDRSLKRAKRVAVPVFALYGLFLMLLLAFV